MGGEYSKAGDRGMNIAVIPARGGSKRIPRKNIRPFCGQPMIAYAITTAQRSGLFDHIMVSTDDAEIAAVARQWGADVPFVRPTELSDDYTATRPVVNHAITEAKRVYGEPRYVCVIYATAPFLEVDDLKRGYDTLVSSQADFAFSVTSYPYPIQRALKLSAQGGVEMFQPEHCKTRSQDLEQAYHDAGQFYWGTTQAFLGNQSIFSISSTPVILPNDRVRDIDTEEDWITAEIMFTVLNG